MSIAIVNTPSPAEMDYYAFAFGAGLLFALVHLLCWRGRRFAVVAVIAWLCFLAVLAGGRQFVNAHASRERQRLQEIATGFATTYAAELGRMGHQQITAKTSPDDPRYFQLISAEKRWLAANPSIADIFTLRVQTDGKAVVIVDSETDFDHSGSFEGDGEQRADIGKIYDGDLTGLARQALDGRPAFQVEPMRDPHGAFVTALAPVRDFRGDAEAVLAVRFDAQPWIAATVHGRRAAMGGLAALLAIVAGVSAIFALRMGQRDLAQQLRGARSAARHPQPEPSAVSAASPELESKLREQQTRSETLEAKLHEQQTRAQELEAQLRAQQTVAPALEAALREQRGRAEGLESILVAQRQTADEAEARLREQQSRAQELEAQLHAQAQAVPELEAKLRAEQTRLGELEAKMAAQQGALLELDAKRGGEQEAGIDRQKLATLVNSIDGIVWEADATTSRFAFVSQQSERLLGYTPEQWTTTNDFWKSKLHPDDVRAFAQREKLVASKEPYSFEYRMIASDGRTVWIRENAGLLLDAAGAPLLIRGVFYDITAQKTAAAELEQANAALVESSRHAGMAEVATGVLHNVGNVLNSVNVSGNVISERLRKSKVIELGKVAGLLTLQAADFAGFVARDPRGPHIPELISCVTDALKAEHADLLEEVESITRNIGHIKEIVAMQQGFAKGEGIVESCSIQTLVDDAIKINAVSLARHRISVVQAYEEVPSVLADKHLVLQILVNLLRNAKQAIESSTIEPRRIVVRIQRKDDAFVRVAVQDSGTGIAPENLTRIFSHGFTTKKSGHGFGLHSSALAATGMGGSLHAQSDGPGTGATFLLELPVHVPAQVAAAA